MIKSSSDNYRKSSAECLAIGFCLYTAITFQNNLTEAKLANELITSVQSLKMQLIQSCLISWPARLAKSWVLQTFHVWFPVLVNHAK